MAAAASLADHEIRTAPPLRLPPERSARIRRRAARRWRNWIAPVASAAVVAALAIALVIIKDVPNGGRVPASPSASAPTGPGGIPRYYVAVSRVTGQPGSPNTLRVGDSRTGETIATLQSPGHMSFESVMAANDDRTFVVYALAKSGSAETGNWFRLRLAPGTADPARLTPLPVKPMSVPLGQGSFPQYGIFAMALSGSGQDLAVAEVPSAAGGVAVKVFSLADGRLLHDWTTDDPSISVPGAWTYGLVSPSALTWIDGDQALALTTPDKAASSGTGTETVRALNVDGPPNGDLLTDSKVIWTTPPAPATATAGDTQLVACGILLLDRVPPMISADGKTASCASMSQDTGSSATGWTETFSSYQLGAGTTAADRGTVAYQVTRQLRSSSGVSGAGDLLWVSPSGGTLIGAWGVAGVNASIPLNVGVISHGTFTPLRFPAGFTWTDLGDVAW
jgi:hypothetical protein